MLIRLLILVVIFCAGFVIHNWQSYNIIEGTAFGTYYHIITDKENENISEIEQEFATINKQFSVFYNGSEINNINKAKAKEAISVSMALANVLMKSKEFYKKTNGNFDPTTGNLVDMWGFGPDYNKSPPSEAQIKKALASVGMDKLEINGKVIIKLHDDLYLNLSAIAKGYAVDRVAKILKDNGYKNFLIEIGGEVYAKGNRNIFEDGWNVGIKNPVTKKLLMSANFTEIGMATSGDYEKFIEVGGNKYSHLINPKTGKPTLSNLASVSVFADDVMTADAYATALIVMGYKNGMLFANKNKIMAVFLIYENDSLKIITSNSDDDFWNTKVILNVQKNG